MTARFLALRLMPGEEVLSRLLAAVEDSGAQAAAVVSAVGSLSEARLRFAEAETGENRLGPFEVVSLVGTLGLGRAHLHLSLADRSGHVTGGHMQAPCRVFTTLEVVLLLLDEMAFDRKPCAISGYEELVIRKIRSQGGPL